MNDQTKHLPDSALDALLDHTHQQPQELRFSFLTRTLNRLSFMKALNDKEVNTACAAVAARLRALHQTKARGEA